MITQNDQHFIIYANLQLMQADFSLQIVATCNIEQSFFNDWFTGHLNFQIEHQWVMQMIRYGARADPL